jgi:hypothetical protein
MAYTDSATEPSAIGLQTRSEVVEESSEWANVEHRGASPFLLRHSRQEREERSLRLPAGGRSQKENIVSPQNGFYSGFLGRSERVPAEGVDEVVLEDRVQSRSG